MNLTNFNNKTIYIFPYNDIGLKFKSLLNISNIRYNSLAFIDNYKALSIDLGYEIHKPDHLRNHNFDYVVITSKIYYQEIVDELVKLNIPSNKIIYGIDILHQEQKYNTPIDNTLIKQYYNKHKGNRCFIIGTGPSLKIEDLEKLKDELTFGANGLFLGLQQTRFRPTYYSVCDVKSMEFFYAQLDQFFDKRTTMIFPKHVLKATYPLKNSIYYNSNQENKKTFDLYEGIYTGKTVIYNLISIAIYMGIKEIYLIGLDLNYDFMDKIQSNHFIENYPEDKNQNSALIEIQTWINDFINLADILKNKDINIYNSTRGGKLEIFPRVNFDDII